MMPLATAKDQIVTAQIERELCAGDGSRQLQFEVIGVIARVEFAEQETGIGVVRGLVFVASAVETGTGVRVQAEQPREHEAEAQHPDGGLTRHSCQFSTETKAGSAPRSARRRHRRCRCA